MKWLFLDLLKQLQDKSLVVYSAPSSYNGNERVFFSETREIIYVQITIYSIHKGIIAAKIQFHVNS